MHTTTALLAGRAWSIRISSLVLSFCHRTSALFKMKKSTVKQRQVYDLFDEPDPDQEDDVCAFVCFVVGVISMFIVVGAIATLIVLGVDDRRDISSLTSTHHAKPLSSGVMDSIMDPSVMYRGVIDDTTPTTLISVELELLVLVHSLPGNVSARNAIRATWMTDMPTGAEVLFVVPAKNIEESVIDNVKQESKTHRDMVVFLDSPVVPESEALMLQLVWSARARKFAYLMKTRDSMYVRLDTLMSKVVGKLLKTGSNAYLGYFQGQQDPRDKTSGKLSEPNWHLCDKFIRYAHSGGYILSGTLVNRLELQMSMLYPYNNEDVALGTWLSPYADVDWTHTIHFDTEIGRPRGCRNDLIVFQPTDMVAQHNRLTSSRDVCLLEHEIKKTYHYNFNTLPSQCCSAVKFNKA